MWLRMSTPIWASRNLATVPAATRAAVSRAEARSSTSRASASPYLSMPERSAWPGRGWVRTLPGSPGAGDISSSHFGHSVLAISMATGEPIVRPCRIPPIRVTSSASNRILGPRPYPSRRRASPRWMSSAVTRSPAGTPSRMTTRARPWDSPAVRKRSIQANLLVAAMDPSARSPPFGLSPVFRVRPARSPPHGPRQPGDTGRQYSDRPMEDGLDDRGAPQHSHDGPCGQGRGERDPRPAPGTPQRADGDPDDEPQDERGGDGDVDVEQADPPGGQADERRQPHVPEADASGSQPPDGEQDGKARRRADAGVDQPAPLPVDRGDGDQEDQDAHEGRIDQPARNQTV